MASVESPQAADGTNKASSDASTNAESGSLSAAISPSGPYDEAVLLIKVNIPKGEPIDVMVTAGDLAQEVYNQVCESETSLHRTCYTLHMTGPSSSLADHVAVPVDPFQELKAVEPVRLYLETHFAALAAAAAAANNAAAAAAAASVTNGKPIAGEKPQLTQAPIPSASGDTAAEKLSESAAKPAVETSSATAQGAAESAPKEKSEAGAEPDKDGDKEESRAQVQEAKTSGKRGGKRGGQAQGGAAGKHWRAHARWLKSSGLLDAANEPAPPPPPASTPPLPQAPPLVFTLVEEPYTAREARLHVRHVRELLRGPSGNLADAYAGLNGASLSFATSLLGGGEKRPANARDRAERERAALQENLPPEYLLPGYQCPLTPTPAPTPTSASDSAPGSKPSRRTLPLAPLQPLSQADLKGIKCVNSLDISPWSPPPASRKLRGDLLYVRVLTLENVTLHLTACSRGFYVNCSTDTLFNPSAAPEPYLAHSLVDLLKAVSPGFRRGWDALLKRRAARNPLESQPGPLPHFASVWLAPPALLALSQHTPDLFRLADSVNFRAIESQQSQLTQMLSGQPRDWNEELQQCRALPYQTLQQRLLRHRVLFKTATDFIISASRSACGVLEGQLQPVNPSEPLRSQMFIHNNMFFSLGYDVKDHYKELGGDAAAYVAAKLDQAGMKAYEELEIFPALVPIENPEGEAKQESEELKTDPTQATSAAAATSTSTTSSADSTAAANSTEKQQEASAASGSKLGAGTASTAGGLGAGASVPPGMTLRQGLSTIGSLVVDYRGARVAVQAVMPGILEKPQDEQLKYGTVDFGKNVLASEDYKGLLEKTAAALHIKPHKVLDAKTGAVHELFSSVECKGITGTDQRRYILDILRSTPVDLNFVPLQVRHRHHLRPTGGCADDEEVVLCEEGDSETPRAREFAEGELIKCDECKVHEELRKYGFPHAHAHRLAVLRPELVDAFVEFKYGLYVRLLAYEYQEAGLFNERKGAKKTTDGETGESTGDSEKSAKEASEKAAKDAAEKAVAEKAPKEEVSGSSGTPSKPAGGAHLERIVRQNLYGTASAPAPLADNKATATGASDARQSGAQAPEEATKKAASSDEAKTPPTQSETGTQSESGGALALSDAEMEAKEHELTQKCLQQIGSCSPTVFSIRLNPDIYLPIIKHKGKWSELKAERRLAREASEFLLLHQLPLFIESVAEHSTLPYDGATLVEAMHAFGINVRYIGTLVDRLVADPSRCPFIFDIAVAELLTRCIKRVWREYISRVEWINSAHAIAHFLNCLFNSSTGAANIVPPSEELQPAKQKESGIGGGGGKKKGSKKAAAPTSQPGAPLPNGEVEQGAGGAEGAPSVEVLPPSAVAQSDSLEWTRETPRSLWTKIAGEARSYYHCQKITEDATLEWVQEELCANLSRTVLLRAVCVACGLQLALKDYALEAAGTSIGASAGGARGAKAAQTQMSVFAPDDVLNVLPVISHLPVKTCPDAVQVFAMGHARVEAGAVQEGYELLLESLNQMMVVHGPLHQDIAACCRILARLAYVLGDYNEAFAHQLRATIISERVVGIDKPNTATEYANLALYSFATEQPAPALRLLFRARFIALLNHSECHPEISVIDGNIALFLYAINEFDYALKYFVNAIEIDKICFGNRKSLRRALLHHLHARTASCLGEFKVALLEEKEAFTIYKQILGEQHERTRMSYECMRFLAQQAVQLQRRMKEYALKSGGSAIDASAAAAAAQLSQPPIIVQTPTFVSLRETMNLLNGIIVPPEEMLRNLNVLEAMQSFLAASAAASGQPGAGAAGSGPGQASDAPAAVKGGEGEAATAASPPPPSAPVAVDLD